MSMQLSTLVLSAQVVCQTDSHCDLCNKDFGGCNASIAIIRKFIIVVKERDREWQKEV